MSRPLPMTRGRVIALVIGLPLALAVIGWTGLTWVAYAGEGSYPVRLVLPVHGRSVTLTADSADMVVTQAAGNQVRLTGTARYSLVRSTLTHQVTPSGVSVASHCHFITGDCSFHYQVQLPAGRPAVLSGGSGDMTLRGLTGSVRAGTGSGEMSAFGLSGTATISAGSGDISGGRITGPRAVFHTGSGTIDVTGVASTDVTASAGSGDVTLRFTKVPGQVTVRTGSGTVTLVLPGGGTLYRVNASSGSGQTTVGVPVSSVSPHRIFVRAGSGDITITRAAGS